MRAAGWEEQLTDSMRQKCAFAGNCAAVWVDSKAAEGSIDR